MDAKLLGGIAAGALGMYVCGPTFSAAAPKQPAGRGSTTATPRDAKSVRVAGLFTPGSPQAVKVEAAVLAAGATWLGAEEEFESFSDEAVGSMTVLAAQKVSGEKLGRNYSKLTDLEWFQTWSAGVEHIFRGNKCPVRLSFSSRFSAPSPHPIHTHTPAQ